MPHDCSAELSGPQGLHFQMVCARPMMLPTPVAGLDSLLQVPHDVLQAQCHPSCVPRPLVMFCPSRAPYTSHSRACC